MTKKQPLLQVNNLVKYYYTKGGSKKEDNCVYAVDGISFTVNTGETFGLVGESGCGKSTAALSILRLIEPTSGQIIFDGYDLRALSKAELRAMRRQIQIVFQDPYASLNPRCTVHTILREPLMVHKLYNNNTECEKRINELLNMVGLRACDAARYPHEFSGGQRQRIGIARALALNPQLIVCDEPVSALDVSIQSQILNLLADLQDHLGLTYIFITHALNVVKHISTQIGVMYLGKIIEIATSDELFDSPLHPYTQALLSAVPVPNPEAAQPKILTGDVPSPMNPPSGCRFRTRCEFVMEKCRTTVPELRHFKGHKVACHLYDLG